MPETNKSHLSLTCEVHLPSDEMWEVLNTIDELNKKLPSELSIVSLKTKGGVIIKLDDINEALGLIRKGE